MTECLTPTEIEGLVAGSLPPEEKARAEAHLAECEKCREQFRERQAHGDLADDIKQACAETVTSPKDDKSLERSPGPVSDSIEGYEILSEIHRGGQGVVYKAVQKATKRTVALKVLLEGPYASPRQRHRFEREVDLVSSLHHPHIVTVYDSGVTRDGRHYFAMEYIHGQPLDVYLSDKKLSIDETLRLFQKICSAVNHAHQRGVIHRDLKPGNIRIDANGEPHVLDFGLAKAGATGLTPEGAPVTVTGEFMGTLAYASPEQTKGDPTLVDIRSDVYSLGVILYEMLTGKYPYQVMGQMAEVLRNIAEAEPERPSTIRRQINDEVETIVLKALAKEKERRYQSADTLGRDIDNYLNGEPIDAKRDSAWYVLGKTLRRYRVPAAIGAAFAMVLTTATVALSIMYRSQAYHRERAEVALQKADEARGTAVEERERAEANEAKATAAAEQARREGEKATLLLQSLQKWLTESVRPSEPDRAEMTVREMVDQAANKIDTQYADRPEIRATLLLTVGQIYSEMYARDRAEQVLNDALEIRRRLFGDASLEVAEVFMALSEMPRAEHTHSEQALDYCRKAMAIRQKLLGQDHELSAKSRTWEAVLNLVTGREADYFKWLIPVLIYQFNPNEFPEGISDGLVKARKRWEAADSEGAITTVWQHFEEEIGRAQTLWTAGEHESARDVVRAIYTPFLRHPVLRTWVVSGIETVSENPWWTKARRDPDAREPLLREAVGVAREVYGDDSKELAHALTRLGELLIERNNHVEAEGLLVEAQRIYRKLLGEEHEVTLWSMYRLANVVQNQGRYIEAEELYAKMLEIQRRVLGEEHPDTLRTCLISHLSWA